MKYFCFVPVVNRLDLLENAIKSVEGQFDEIVIIDNTAGALDAERAKFARHRIVSTGCRGFVPSMNWAHHHALDNNYDFYIFMHNDGEAHGDMPTRFVRHVEDCISNMPDCGVVFTHYDVISAFSTKMARVVGEWGDDQWPNKEQIGSYCVDIDYYRRVRLAGFRVLQSALGRQVTHHGSSTIKADSELCKVSDRNHELAREHCRRKWGDYERGLGFSVPYGTAAERELLHGDRLKSVIPERKPGWEIRQTSSGDYVFRIRFRRFRGLKMRWLRFRVWGRALVPCSASAIFVWELCDGKRTAYDITEQLARRFDMDRFAMGDDVLECIRHLRNQGILAPGRPLA